MTWTRVRVCPPPQEPCPDCAPALAPSTPAGRVRREAGVARRTSAGAGHWAPQRIVYLLVAGLKCLETKELFQSHAPLPAGPTPFFLDSSGAAHRMLGSRFQVCVGWRERPGKRAPASAFGRPFAEASNCPA